MTPDKNKLYRFGPPGRATTPPDKNKLYRFVTLTMEDVGLIEAMLGDGSIVEVDGPAYRIDLKTEKPIPGRYLANDSDLVSYLKNRGVLVEVGEERP